MTHRKNFRKNTLLLVMLLLTLILSVPIPAQATVNNTLSMKSHRNELEYYKYSVNGQVVNEGLKGNVNTNGDKVVFLTFDDGPSTTVTPKILEVLKDENVKATFFLLGNNIEVNERSKDIVKTIYENGHAIGNHTYTHKYNQIYPNNRTNVEIYLEEMEKTETALKNVLGEAYGSNVIRMPGGIMSRRYYKDTKAEELNTIIVNQHMSNIDWNASTCDSSPEKLSSNQLVEAAKKSIGKKNFVVLLMHDTYGKEETAKALPEIIHYLKDNGYEFRIIG